MSARANPPPFEACLKDAQVLARDWIPRWLGQLQKTLQQCAATASHHQEKQAYLHAGTVLVGARDRMADQFLKALSDGVQAAQERATGNAPRVPSTQRAWDGVSMEDLELMDHLQVQATVELARLQQVVKMAADSELLALGALLSGAQGLPAVRQEANPLRPEVVIAALMQALSHLHVDEAARMRWLHVGAVPLGAELQRFYRDLALGLEQRNVQPAAYVVVPTVVAHRAAVAEGSTRPESAPLDTKIGDAAVLTLDHLHQLLVGNLDHGGEVVSDQGASGSGNAMVRTLAVEVVALMLRTIAQDQRLLPSVRDMVQQLKPVLLHLARAEPRFFADRHNPARRLLDTITARSLAFSSEQDTGYAEYAQQVHDVVKTMNASTSALPDRIVEQLNRLLPQSAPDQGLAMQTLVHVEQRHLLAEHVAREIQARPDFGRAPGLVRRFLCDPWAQVLAHARLHLGTAGKGCLDDVPAQRYMDILPDLLWSCQLAQASLNRPRLVRVVPAILRTLREGLDSIDYPRVRAEAFFQGLMGLHEAAYKTRHNGDPAAPLPPRGDEPAPEPWMHAEEARHSGFVDTLLAAPDFADTQPFARGLSLLASEPLPELAVGAWVELEQQDVVRRCQLRWASPHGTLFLFNTAEGLPISLTRQGLDRLSAQGRLRVVAGQGILDEALAAVARQAWINSGKL
ncbi:DUF1631 family protein [Hydrogenophaga sp. A37]|uniref:DUF1631 family protein n=1 Tax=Hydrogenophaga sp. A37 TaxID=1945864 RepID=UPI000987576F|nr:DUF1631 family protein [Hydrogenophaga sp. A37]OOG79760.1 hypothetical protein B0E41_22250 [Hydrogenophaga sp. A37]